jgi:hypothetical protein
MEGELSAPSNFKVEIVNEIDVKLSWDPVLDADHYIVYKSSTRDGFNNLSLLSLWETNYYDPYDTTYTDKNALSIGMFDKVKQNFYMVVAVDDPSIHDGFNGTYSIGIWSERKYPEYDTLGLPLKPDNVYSIDWYCDDIENIWGMNYYNIDEQRWVWHKTIMPKGAYDPDMTMGEGYQLSITGSSIYSFIGI